MPTVFRLTLEKTYYRQGFFNVPVAFDQFVRATEGPVDLILGPSGTRIQGKVDRSANRNGTARVMGRSTLRDWFQANHAVGDIIDVDLSLMDSIRIG